MVNGKWNFQIMDMETHYFEMGHFIPIMTVSGNRYQIGSKNISLKFQKHLSTFLKNCPGRSNMFQFKYKFFLAINRETQVRVYFGWTEIV